MSWPPNRDRRTGGGSPGRPDRSVRLALTMTDRLTVADPEAFFSRRIGCVTVVLLVALAAFLAFFLGLLVSAYV